MRHSKRRVLLAFGWYDYRLHQGIAQYAVEHDWHLCPDVTKEKVIPWGWTGDGILALLGAGDDLAEFVTQTKLPTVDFSYRRPNLFFPRVLADHAAAARLAAEHFLSRGLRRFLFYSAADNWSFEEAGEAFVREIQQAGHHCEWIRWHHSPAFTVGPDQWQQKRRWLAACLKKEPKPLAVFAASDDHALEVVEACESAGLATPEEVAVVGMDNAIVAVDAMRTPISSVDRNLETLGYRGAELLDHLMNGAPPPREPIRIPPSGLISRKSSDLLAINHPGVARSLRFLWGNFHKPIGVDELAEVAAMSRSGLHKAYMDHLGRPPGEELQRVRIGRAKELLGEPGMKLAALAEKCGYRSPNSFGVAFKQATGMAPSEFQKKFRR